MKIARGASLLIAIGLLLGLLMRAEVAAAPPLEDYCQRLQQEIQGKKHGFLAGNLAYYVGGFHASWKLYEQETLGLTHPFHHDLRSRGVGLVDSRGQAHEDTGRGNDFSGWEFYKDTRVLYGSVLIDGQVHSHPVPTRMYWRPDRMICEYEVGGVRLREQKFIAANDAACTIITSSRPVTLRFSGQSFFGRHSVASTATIAYEAPQNAIHIVEGGTTKCRPETDRAERVGAIMYEGMSTVLTASENFAASHQFTRGDQGQMKYSLEVPCDAQGVTLVWAMHDQYAKALENAVATCRTAKAMMTAKTQALNRELSTEIPWFRCSEQKFEQIYYYLWSLYLMYYIDVQQGWEQEPHTQTAVNNFLGMHRYDATFQIRVGAWTNHQSHYAYGNVLTWKHLFQNGHFRKTPNGVVALADNKGTSWHSGVYGLEHSEHVLGAWLIYEHTGDPVFLRQCYEGYFREMFWDRIPSFFANHFEVARVLAEMARLTGNASDVAHWQQAVNLDPNSVRNYFDQRWEMHGHPRFFAGPENGMLMTTGFWYLRSKHFPREYAKQMVDAWALDRVKGFYGDYFPLAMSRQAMQQFATKVDHSFGYTPDTAYFTLSGMFQQRLGDPAWRLTLNHLEHYNWHADWQMPVAPEAYTRGGKLFGDQYSNFNAGKLLLFLEGLAGLEYSVPEQRLTIRDTMPTDWTWMEVRLPVRTPGQPKTAWPAIRFERAEQDGRVTKTIRVTNSPLQLTIEPWTEGKAVVGAEGGAVPGFQEYRRYHFDRQAGSAEVKLQLQ